jgi:hypothetical protein
MVLVKHFSAKHLENQQILILINFSVYSSLSE